MLKSRIDLIKYWMIEMDRNDRNKFWVSILAIFVFGALTSNAAWLYYTNVKDARFEARIERVESSYKYQLGQQRAKIESKIDRILDRLDRFPQSPIILDVRTAIEEAKNE